MVKCDCGQWINPSKQHRLGDKVYCSQGCKARAVENIIIHRYERFLKLWRQGDILQKIRVNTLEN